MRPSKRPNQQQLKEQNTTLLQHYAHLLIERKDELAALSSLLAVDCYFSKHSFVDNMLQNTDLNIISRLRDDAVLLYQYTGPTTGKSGRPQVYDGKVNVKNPFLNHLSIAYEDDQIRIFSGVVYVKSLQRKVKIAIAHYLETNKSKIRAVKIYFCTDINLSAWHIVKIYKLRFQFEFLYQDANQFTGLEQCQARSEQKLHYHRAGDPV